MFTHAEGDGPSPVAGSSSSSPSTVRFLQQAMLDPRSTGYAATGGSISQLYRSLWTSIFSHVHPAYLLPREVAPSTMHALVFLERCNWKLCVAQKRAATVINEQRREQLGGMTSIAATQHPSASAATSSSLALSESFPLASPSSSSKGKFVTPRSATPPPGVSLDDDLETGEYGEGRKGMPCGHVFRKGEAIYRCRDCALDDTCVLCAPCFRASDHEGHDIIFSVSNSGGGCCDCGDEEAWTKKVHCRYHSLDHEDDSSGAHSCHSGPSSNTNAASNDDVAMQEDDTMDSHLQSTSASFDAKGKGPERSRLTASDHVRQIDTLLQSTPIEAKEGFLSQVSSLITFILDTMEHAPTEMKLPEGVDAIDQIKRQSTLEPLSDSEEHEMSNYTPGPGAYSFDSPGNNRIYSVVLWNDEKHSFRDVIDIVCEATGKSETEAKGIAERVDRHGREIIETSSEVRRLFQIAHKLAQIDLTVTVRPAYDIYAEEIAGHVLELLLDLANASFYVEEASTTRQDAPEKVHPLDGLVPSAIAMRALVGKAFLDPWQHRKPISPGEMSSNFFDSHNLVHLDGMLLMDHKFWKGARTNARSLYMALIGPKEVKRAIAYRFASMYAKLVEIFIIHNREPENSIRFIAVQLFSVPSIATELVSSLDLLFKMLQILQSIFTGQLTSGTLTLPPLAPPRMQANSSSMPVRQQRCHHILYDLRYLISAEGVQKQIVSNPRHLNYFTDFLTLFNAITPDKRAVSEHVEFESEIWFSVFHVATHLARIVKLFGEAYNKGTEQNVIDGIRLAMGKALLSCSHLHQDDPEVHSAVSFEHVRFADQSYHVIDFAVESMGVSFHHPLHWLLAEMFKCIDKIDGARLKDVVPEEISENGLLILFDYPLRVVVKLAQIRAGLWVRNGFGIRSQAHHYRDNGMRDVMFDQDLFMLQCSLVFVNPDRMLVTFVQRFCLESWLQTQEPPQGFELAQILFLAEELLLLLVTLLSETSMATNWSLDRQVRREIVHFLSLSQGTYSELTRHISDKLKDHANFDRILASVSNYRAPDGTNDLGIFELKDECYDEVQPFFFHFTRNQREKAEHVLNERQKRKPPAEKAARHVTVPQKILSTGESAFLTSLRDVFGSRVLVQILFFTLSNVRRAQGDTPDGLVESALQLLMIGLVEGGQVFATRLAEPVQGVQADTTADESLITILLSLRTDERFTYAKAKIEWALETAAALDVQGCSHLIEEAWKSQERKDVESQQASAEEKRKAAARARQAAIMQKFSAQQKSLLESLGDDEDDDSFDDEFSSSDAMDLGNNEKQKEEVKVVSYGSCIFCQEDLNHMQAFGSLAHIQHSRVMRSTPRHDPHSLQQSLYTPLTLDRNGRDGKRVHGFIQTSTNLPLTDKHNSAARQWDGFPAEDRRFGFYASTCGHLMHLECFDVYSRSIEQRHAQQIARNHPEDPARSEFVCPLCKSLGNIVLPVPKVNKPSQSTATTEPTQYGQSISDWIRKINIDILKTSTNTLRADLQETEHGTGCFVPWFAEDAQGILDSWMVRGNRANDRQTYANRQILERLCRVLRSLSTRSRSMRVAHQSRTILAPPSRKMYIPEEVIAYTIAILEISQRGATPLRKDGGTTDAQSQSTLNVADAMSEQTIELIVALITCLRNIAQIEEPNYQTVLRHGLLMRLLPHWGGHDTVRSPLVLRDTMTVLVETAAIIPENLPQVTVLMFYVHLIQVVFGVAQPSLWPQTGPGGAARGIASLRNPLADESYEFGQSDTDALQNVFDDVRGTVANIIGLVGYARGNVTLGVDNLDDASLAKMICTYCLPFLRRAVILQRSMGVLPVAAVKDEDSSTFGGDGKVEAEFPRLMKLLGIPLPREALSATATRQTALAGLVEGWIKHAYPQLASIFRPLPIQPSPLSASSSGKSATGHHHHHNHHPTLQLEHPHIYELIRLPVTLTELLMHCQALKCRRCGNAPPEPAICLECGELLCFQSFCCQGTLDGHGECNRHLEECGHSSGLFFRIKSNVIILLFQGKGCFTYSPYLDAHGEIDIGLKKGKIQFLHAVRFDELRKQWLQHGLANMIARKMEAVMDQGGWETM